MDPGFAERTADGDVREQCALQCLIVESQEVGEAGKEHFGVDPAIEFTVLPHVEGEGPERQAGGQACGRRDRFPGDAAGDEIGGQTSLIQARVQRYVERDIAWRHAFAEHTLYPKGGNRLRMRNTAAEIDIGADIA